MLTDSARKNIHLSFDELFSPNQGQKRVLQPVVECKRKKSISRLSTLST